MTRILSPQRQKESGQRSQTRFLHRMWLLQDGVPEDGANFAKFAAIGRQSIAEIDNDAAYTGWMNGQREFTE